MKGKGCEVCEAYGKNLNSFNPGNLYNMACERKINPKFTDLKKPEWEEMDLQNNVELLKKIELFLDNFDVTSDNLEGWEEYIKSRIKDKYVSIKLSQLYILNDGTVNDVVKYAEEGCTSGKHYGALLLVLNDDLNDINIVKSKPLMQNSRYMKNGPLSEGWEYSMYDVFIYKNKTYFDRWSADQWPLDKAGKNKIKLLKVFVIETDKASNASVKEICRYKFRSSK
ncbi:MAG: hypothetical protein KJ826_09340 [Proteobacteria bacterium]|nr:hypothetical protein [Pseudomonadota bacterium]